MHLAPTVSCRLAPQFDRVLVDAPCSGLGTIRRDPDIRWRRHEADLPALARTQLALLERAASLVRTGGRLVYATCSSEPEENEAVVDAFLARHVEFELVDLRVDGGRSLSHCSTSVACCRRCPSRTDSKLSSPRRSLRHAQAKACALRNRVAACTVSRRRTHCVGSPPHVPVVVERTL